MKNACLSYTISLHRESAISCVISLGQPGSVYTAYSKPVTYWFNVQYAISYVRLNFCCTCPSAKVTVRHTVHRNIYYLNGIKKTLSRNTHVNINLKRLQLHEYFVSWDQSVSIELDQCNGMMTSSNGNIFRVTGHLCGESTGHRWIPSTKASHTEFWCFLWSAPE